MTFEEEFSAAYQNWEIEKLYLDLADAVRKPLSPNAKIFLRGILCGNSPSEIAKKLNYRSKNISDTVRQTLSKEVYPAIENLVNSGNKINWRKSSENSVSQLLKDYRKKPENLPPIPTEIKIDWRGVCAKMLEKQQSNQQLRRKATQIGCEVEVFVELGLVEPKLSQRHNDNNGMEKFREKEVITRTYEYDEFLLDVIQRKKNKFTAIVGEAGSGKTTWLDKIATYLKNTNDLYICIPLGELQGKTLEEYILQKWLSNALLLIDLDIDLETLEKPLIKLLQKNEVWLLLDGVDEIGETSAGKTLRNIQQQLTGFLSAARVVLTCRTNVWDVNFNNPLSGFETYKTLEFKFEQVDDFIHQWFAKAENKKRGKKLEQKLKESRHERIYDLVRNPLRLSLLCQIFYFDENAELPETKAGLYQQFIGYFYEWKPEKISIDWNVQPNLKNQLHQALGRVALAGLDSSERFRLSESLIHKEIQDDELFNLAFNLDLLILVDSEVKTGKFVYGFLHPTFQEYFAALSIEEDWHYFLNHIPLNPSQGSYRIFEPQWKEVFLHWLGQKSIPVQLKEELMKALVNFEDGWEKFYKFQAYFIAAAGLAEFKNFSLADEIIEQIIEWCYHDSILFDSDNLLEVAARKSLQETDSIRLVNRLNTILEDSLNYSHSFEQESFTYQMLNQFIEEHPEPEKYLETLAEECNDIFDFYECDSDRTLFARMIIKVNPCHLKAVETLIKEASAARKNANPLVFSEACEGLTESNILVSHILEKFIEFITPNQTVVTYSDYEDRDTIYDEIRLVGAAYIKEIDRDNPHVLITFLDLLKSEDEGFFERVIEELSHLYYLSHPSDIIPHLIYLLKSYPEEEVCLKVAQTLVKIKPSNQEALIFLENTISNNPNGAYKLYAARTLWEINPDDFEETFGSLLNKNQHIFDEPEAENFLKFYYWSFEPIDLTVLKDSSFSKNKSKGSQDNLINISVNKNLTPGIFNKNIWEIFLTDKCRSFQLNETDVWEFNQTTPNSLFPTTVAILKDYFEDDFEDIEDDYENPEIDFYEFYKSCHDILWHCAQHMNYPDFYNAWHSPSSTTYLETTDNIPVTSSTTIQYLNLTQLPTILRQNLANNPNLNQTILPICIDGVNFTNPDNPAPDIYIEMIEKGCPEITPTPTKMSSLKTYWRLNLKKLDKQIALIFYTSKSDRSFSETFLTTLSTLGGSICLISDQKCDNIESISPHHPNLIDTIIKWLKQ